MEYKVLQKCYDPSEIHRYKAQVRQGWIGDFRDEEGKERGKGSGADEEEAGE
ncbi:MAG: hypothetical protein ACYDHX_07205 [Methanothrix sp.]